MNQHARVASAPIPFIDVPAQRRRLGSAIDEAVGRVLNHCQFLMGPEVTAFEQQLAQFCGAKYAVSCASGTDALMLILMARGVGPGDGVICPSFTFAATAEAAALVGASPVFADVDAETFNINTGSLKRAMKAAKDAGLTPKVIVPVDLFGLPADHDAIAAIAAEEKLFVLDDAAQGFGGSYKGKTVGALAPATATSFFPAKPLGCYGDGGAITTDDAELVEILKSLRIHGQGTDRYDNIRIGITGRLDTIQAAVLIEKLKIFGEELEARQKIASRYNAALNTVAHVPQVPDGYSSTWAQYTLRVKPAQRDALAETLKARGIPTAVYYGRGLHQQTAYKHYPVAGNGLPVTEQLTREVISLPMHPYLEAAVQDRIIEAVLAGLQQDSKAHP